jgi:hypothetical protein
MTDLSVVQELPTPILTLSGFSDKGAMIHLGTLSLIDPSTRENTIMSLLDYIDECWKGESMCRLGAISFNPAAFDFFRVD